MRLPCSRFEGKEETEGSTMKHYELACVTCDRCNEEVSNEQTTAGVDFNVEGHDFDLCRECWGAFKNLFIGGLYVKAVVQPTD
jgi:hypothetical protein